MRPGQQGPAGGTGRLCQRSLSSSRPLDILMISTTSVTAAEEKILSSWIDFSGQILTRNDTWACFTRAGPREKSVNLPTITGVNPSHLFNSSFSPLHLPAGHISLRSLSILLKHLPTVKMSRGTKHLSENGTYSYLRAPWDRQKSELLSTHIAFINIWKRMPCFSRPCFRRSKWAWKVQKDFWDSWYQLLLCRVFSTCPVILHCKKWGQL